MLRSTIEVAGRHPGRNESVILIAGAASCVPCKLTEPRFTFEITEKGSAIGAQAIQLDPLGATRGVEHRIDTVGCHLWLAEVEENTAAQRDSLSDLRLRVGGFSDQDLQTLLDLCKGRLVPAAKLVGPRAFKQQLRLKRRRNGLRSRSREIVQHTCEIVDLPQRASAACVPEVDGVLRGRVRRIRAPPHFGWVASGLLEKLLRF
jgi:hypothetical protein